MLITHTHNVYSASVVPRQKPSGGRQWRTATFYQKVLLKKQNIVHKSIKCITLMYV